MTRSRESYFSGGGFFRGDLGRVTTQGQLQLCGRHRGFANLSDNKVDPTEVEAALLELADVSE